MSSSYLRGEISSIKAKFKKAWIGEASSSTPPQNVGSKISNSLFRLFQPAPPQIISMDIIFQFEHNSDAYLSTWIRGESTGDALTPQEVWPERWLPAKFPGSRIISVSYDASIGTTGMEEMTDMHPIGENLLGEVLMIRRGQGKECPVVLVGHSFGGLVIKQLCVHAHINKEKPANGQGIREFLQSIRGIFFYGTPHRGFNLDFSWDDLVSSSMPTNKPLLSFVKALGQQASRLHEEFELRWKDPDYKWLIYGLGEEITVKRQCTLLVPEGSSRFGDTYMSVESVHFSICRPVNTTCIRYMHLVDLIDVIYDEKDQDERRKQMKVCQNLVGLQNLLAEVQESLQEHKFLGFSGMGGVGKTTIARLAFNTLSAKFEYTCFVREVKLLGGNKEEIKQKIWKNMRCHGHPMQVGTEVSGKKLLVVFDDIDRREHIHLLREIADNASIESRFITTSRDVELLKLLVRISIYPVQFLEHKFARELFISHAFPGQGKPPERLKQGGGGGERMCRFAAHSGSPWKISGRGKERPDLG